jgi:hypothetical protein
MTKVMVMVDDDIDGWLMRRIIMMNQKHGNIIEAAQCMRYDEMK